MAQITMADLRDIFDDIRGVRIDVDRSEKMVASCGRYSVNTVRSRLSEIGMVEDEESGEFFSTALVVEHRRRLATNYFIVRRS